MPQQISPSPRRERVARIRPTPPASTRDRRGHAAASRITPLPPYPSSCSPPSIACGLSQTPQPVWLQPVRSTGTLTVTDTGGRRPGITATACPETVTVTVVAVRDTVVVAPVSAVPTVEASWLRA